MLCKPFSIMPLMLIVRMLNESTYTLIRVRICKLM